MWGTLTSSLPKWGKSRFIPTHVGNTASTVSWSSVGSVHPHACGEHLIFASYNHYITGSSPRMWGTHEGEVPEHLQDRFIPTHVGNTVRGIRAECIWTVHPHACGEHAAIAACTCSGHGSSPRMWGTPASGSPEVDRPRFIPTHVGNTRTGRGSSTRCAVHPHACGEHS